MEIYRLESHMDRDLNHSPKLVKKSYKDHKVKVLERPSQNTDLSLEHSWSVSSEQGDLRPEDLS